MNYKSYEKYKDSGIDWLGEIPEGWEVKKSRRFSWYEKGKATKPEFQIDDGLPLLSMDYLRNDIIPEFVISSKQDIVINEGEILLLWDGSNAGEFILGKKGILSATIAKISISQEIDSGFAYYIFKSSEGRLKENNIGMGIPHVNGTAFKDYAYCIPPLTEQKAIADFLDKKTAEIDQLIAKKEELLKLLAEQRTALITNAVTKGLNPNAKMKDSGIDWLSEIPKGWEVKPLKFLCNSICTGSTPPSSGEDYFENGVIKWHTPSDFKDSQILSSSVKMLRNEAILNTGQKLFPANSVLIVGIGATLGKVAMSVLPFTANQQINILVPLVTIDGKFLTYTLLVKRETMKVISNASTLGIMNQEKTGMIPIPTPPYEDQKEIADFLDKKTSEIDQTTTKIKEVIERLKEYRTSLITNAVTGKIKVVL